MRCVLIPGIRTPQRTGGSTIQGLAATGRPTTPQARPDRRPFSTSSERNEADPSRLTKQANSRTYQFSRRARNENECARGSPIADGARTDGDAPAGDPLAEDIPRARPNAGAMLRFGPCAGLGRQFFAERRSGECREGRRHGGAGVEDERRHTDQNRRQISGLRPNRYLPGRRWASSYMSQPHRRNLRFGRHFESKKKAELPRHPRQIGHFAGP